MQTKNQTDDLVGSLSKDITYTQYEQNEQRFHRGEGCGPLILELRSFGIVRNKTFQLFSSKFFPVWESRVAESVRLLNILNRKHNGMTLNMLTRLQVESYLMSLCV